MKDIKKAIEIEKYYLECRKKNEYPFHLASKVRECGFESLEEFQKTKQEYQLLNLRFKFHNVAQSEIVHEVHRVLTDKIIGIWFSDSEETCVFNGNQGEQTFNSTFCKENGITTYNYLTSGGSIVHKAGDFSFGVSCPVEYGIDANFILSILKDILQKHTSMLLTVNGNDILMDGSKICGSATYKVGGVFLFLSYFSFSDHLDLIRHICPPPKSGKTPGYIDFMTREQLKQEVSEWLQII